MWTGRILEWLGLRTPVARGSESPQAGGAAAPYKIKAVPLGTIPSDVTASTTSRDGCHVAFVVAKGGKGFVVIDGQAGPAYDGIAGGSPVFSPDGQRVAYGAQKGGKQLVVIDGRPGPEYDGIVKGGPVFRSDGTLEYLAVKAGTLVRVKHVPVEK